MALFLLEYACFTIQIHHITVAIHLEDKSQVREIDTYWNELAWTNKLHNKSHNQNGIQRLILDASGHNVSIES